jgi:thiol-disulfide isomerase/thioredoxin
MKYSNTALLIYFMLNLIIITSCNRSNNNTMAKIHLEGLVDSINDTKVRITNTDFSIAYDSTIVKNNKFKFNTTLPSSGFYVLDFVSPTASFHGMKWSHPCHIYIENNAKYTIYASGPFEILEEFYRIQSSSYDEQKLEQYRALWNKKRKNIDSVSKVFSKKIDYYLSTGDDKRYRDYNDSLLNIDNIRRNSNISAMREFIKANNNTIVTPYFISQMVDYSENYSLYKEVLDHLRPRIKSTKYFEQASDMLLAFEKIRIGKEVPVIAGSDKSGTAYKYSFSKNKYTLIDFWASYCYPCRQDFTQLKSIYGKYKSMGFSIVSVSIDNDKDWWLKASSEEKLPWYDVCEAVKQEDSQNIQNYAVTIIPVNYLLNAKGQLIQKNIELDSLNRLLAKKLTSPK